jgi:hypothetical protein
MSMGTTPLQQSLMHYNARSFKPDKRRPILKLGANEFFQFQAHFGWDLHLITTEPLGDVDGLPVGTEELNAWRTIAEMGVEPAFYVRLEGALHILEQQPLNIAAPEHRSKKLLKRIHQQIRCRGIEGRFTWSKYLERMYSGDDEEGIASRITRCRTGGCGILRRHG